MRFKSAIKVDGARGLERLVFTFQAKEGQVTVGVPRNMRSRPRRGRPSIPLWKLVIWGEEGTPNQPARPVLKTTYDNKGRSWQRSLLSGALMAARRGEPLKKAVRRLGLRVADDVERAYATYRKIPNAPATVANKGKDDPLIERGQMSKAFRSTWRKTKNSGVRPSEVRGIMRALTRLTKRGGSRRDLSKWRPR